VNSIPRLLLIFITSLSIASCGCEKSAGAYKITHLDIKEFKGKIFYDTLKKDTVLTFDKAPEIDSAGTVSYTLAGFRFATTSYFTSDGCDLQLTTPTQKFTSVNITSSTNYVTDTQTFEAGQSLNDLFLLKDAGSENTGELTGYFVFHNFPFYFMLREPPSEISLHNFTFYVSFDDGSEFTATTEPINIAP
jgi:hypothetical protein